MSEYVIAEPLLPAVLRGIADQIEGVGEDSPDDAMVIRQAAERIVKLERQLTAERAKHKQEMDEAKGHVRHLYEAQLYPDTLKTTGCSKCDAAHQWLQEKGK